MGFSHVTHSESIMVGDIEINPGDFSAKLGLEKRIAKCILCHGNHAGGDIDFGPDVHLERLLCEECGKATLESRWLLTRPAPASIKK